MVCTTASPRSGPPRGVRSRARRDNGTATAGDIRPICAAARRSRPAEATSPGSATSMTRWATSAAEAPCCKHHLDRGAPHAPPHRFGQAGIDGLADEVMPEPQTVPVLGQQPGGDRLPDLAPQIQRRPAEQPGQLIEGEAVPEDRSHLHRVPGGRGQPRELADHRVDQPARQARARIQPGRAAVDGHQVLRAQPAQQLGQQERLAVDPAEHLPQRLIGLAAEHVTGDLRDCGLIERAEPDLGRARRLQPADRVLRGVRQLPPAQRQQPADLVGCQPPGQRDQGAGGGGVGPLQVIDDDQQRRAAGGLLECFLQLPQQPEPLVRRLAELVKTRGIDGRLVRRDERVQDRPERHRPRRGIPAAARTSGSRSSAARRTASASSVVFPTPAGPVTITTLPCPALSAFSCPRSTSTWGCRLCNLGGTRPS